MPGTSFDNAAPFEILGSPFQVYIAPTGTAFPDVDLDPPSPWALVGTNGNMNYDDGGVTVSHAQSLNLWRALGSAGPVKAFRASEDLSFSLQLADISLEQYRLVLESATLTTTAGASGHPSRKIIGLSRGLVVQVFALLIKGASPYGDDMAMQYECPRAVCDGSPAPVFGKQNPAMLEMKFTALEDPTASVARERFGRLVAQTGPAVS